VGKPFGKRAGQDDFSAIRDQYYRTGDGFLCVYSIILRSSYDEVKIFHSAIKRVKDSGSRIPFVLVGNKVPWCTRRGPRP
jgi:GTPase SAR1 family protein